MNIDGEDKAFLLQLARRAIEDRLSGEAGPDVAPPPSPSLSIKCGAFVTLYVNKTLRGCIGTFRETDPLYRVVQDMAVAAATCDDRFDPIRTPDLAHLEIEISILSPRKRISGPADIEIGKHGIYLKSNQSSGTLLPQVAVKMGWTAEEFLCQCAMNKAGLHRTGWKKAELYTFEALIFRSGRPA